jgi:hypothetical protein
MNSVLAPSGGESHDGYAYEYDAGGESAGVGRFE